MKDDLLIGRVRAARPAPEESGDQAALFSRIVAEPGDVRMAEASRRRASRLAGKRPQVLAGSTLGIAGVSAALIVALGGATAAAPAFAVTREADGTVLVTVSTDSTAAWVKGADAKLAAMGIDEQIQVPKFAPGPATSPGPVSCDPGALVLKQTASGLTPETVGSATGPRVSVLFGNDGTGVIPAGTTGAGTVHLVSCNYYNTPTGTNSGNTGAAG